jgi:hypothetical protein
MSKEKKYIWKAIGVGDARSRNRAVPTEFIPFEISNAVLGAFAPSFTTHEEAEQFVRSL